MRGYRLLPLVLSLLCVGGGFVPQHVVAQELSAFRVPAPEGLPICPLFVARLDGLGYPFQFGMPCGMASVVYSTEPQSESLEAEPIDCFDDSLSQSNARPAPAMPMPRFEDQTPSEDRMLVENLVREVIGRARRMLLPFTPDRWMAIIDSHLEMIVELAQTGIAPDYCYGPAPSHALEQEETVEEPFTDRTVANHSMTIHVVPEKEVVEPTREILPITLQFTPFGPAPIVTGCLSRLASDPRVMLTRDEALARDYVFDQADLFAEDGYYNNGSSAFYNDDSDCVWAGINGAVCGKVEDWNVSGYDAQQWPAAAAIQPATVCKQGSATDSSWIGCDEAAALNRQQAYASLDHVSVRATDSASSPVPPLPEVAAALLKRLGNAMAELGERLEQLENSGDAKTASLEDPVREQASLNSAIETVDEALLYLGL